MHLEKSNLCMLGLEQHKNQNLLILVMTSFMDSERSLLSIVDFLANYVVMIFVRAVRTRLLAISILKK